MALPPLREMAKLLDGETRGDEVLCPGPGHSGADRSLAVRLDGAAPDGFIVHSFAGDDPITCKDYVRQKCGLPAFEAKPKANGKDKGKAGAQWKLLAEFIYRDAKSDPYLRVRKYDVGGKRKYVQYHLEDGQWVTGKPSGPRIPYWLPELIAAPLTAIVYFAEGEKDVDSLRRIGLTATTMSEGAKAPWPAEATEYFRDRRVVILPDADQPGRQHAEKIARALAPVAASIKIVDLYPGRGDGSDVSDWLATDAVGVKLIKEVNGAPEWNPSAAIPPAGAADEGFIAELAGMKPLDFARRRKAAAIKLGISVGDVDRLVAAARSTRTVDDLALLYDHWQVETWDEPVEGAALFRDLRDCVNRYVIVTPEQATAIALWIVYSWLHEHERFATHSPILLARSPEKDSGKTTLLNLVGFLVRRGLPSVEISGPALFRSIEKWNPSLVVDEADDVLTDNADLRSVINSGWTRGQIVIRCHPDTHDPEGFATFAPKALGMKGTNLPDTTLSRSLIIAMKPKRKDEEVADFDHLDNEDFQRLRRQMLRWTTDTANALAEIKPEMPPGFYNRRRANWRPLLAIAELMDNKVAGWAAALAVEKVAAAEDTSVGLGLLWDVRRVFTRLRVDRFTTTDFVAELITLPEPSQPWAIWRKEKDPITTAQVSNLLKQYNLKSDSVRIPKDNKKTCKGWLQEWFEDAWERYLRPAEPEAETEAEKAGTNPNGEPGISENNDLEREPGTQSPIFSRGVKTHPKNPEHPAQR
jgi:Protein of unknown function (DUF3631)